MKDLKEAAACETLELKRTETLDALEEKATQIETEYSSRVRLKAEHDLEARACESLCATIERIQQERSFFRRLFEPVPQELIDAQQKLSGHVANRDKLAVEVMLSERVYSESSAVVLPLLGVLKEKIKQARVSARVRCAELERRRMLRERQQAEKRKECEENELRKQGEVRAREDARKQELHRLRAIAAAVNGKSRERADTLKVTMRAQFEISSDCPYCASPISDAVELDHIIPVKRGGLSTSENLVFVCRSCNQAKGDQTLAMFLKTRGVERDRVEAALDKLGKHY